MVKLAKVTAARVWLIILAVIVAVAVWDYLKANPPSPNTLVGKVWKLASR